MNDKQRRAMFAKAKLSDSEWNQLVKSHKSIVKDQKQMEKYFPKISRDGGFAFSDLDHYRNARERLDSKLEKLAKKYEYVPSGYTKYQAWHNYH